MNKKETLIVFENVEKFIKVVEFVNLKMYGES